MAELVTDEPTTTETPPEGSDATPGAAPSAPAAPAATGPIGTASGAAVEPAPTTPATTDAPLMSQEQLNERIAQAKRTATTQAKAELKELFGTDDPEQIKSILAERDKMKKDADKAAREQMTKEQRLEADLAAANKRADDMEARVKAGERDRLYDQQNASIRKLAAQHISDDYVDDVAFMYARTVLSGMSKSEAEKITPKDISKWFEQMAKKKPAFARTAAPAPRRTRRQPITNGPRPVAAPTPNSTATSAKTARPGQPNSMSKSEVRAVLKERGLSY